MEKQILKQKTCMSCKSTEVCYIFWERYYPIKQKMSDLLVGEYRLNNKDVEDIANIIKIKLATKCRCYRR
jgi:hypothetical protein